MSNMGVEKDTFGATAQGTPVDRYTLRNARGMMLRVVTYGATVTELWAPDRQGQLDDLVLGFDQLATYETQSPYFGCVVGRVAFRIPGGKFSLDGQDYQLLLNSGKHHLHGGPKGLSKVVWTARPLAQAKCPTVEFTYKSPDGDQGYPGNLSVTMIYSLTEDNEWRIDYTAVTDRPTLVNLTNHSYFNLAGAASGRNVEGQTLQLDADRYSATDATMTPTGELAPVQGTAFDFTKPARIGSRIDQTGPTNGYDLAYLVNRPGDLAACAARVTEPTTGRTLEVRTTQPALIFYTGNALNGTLRGKQGAMYNQRAGLCLETGHLPDSIHHANFPSVVLRPGETFRHTCIYKFAVE